MIWLDNSKIIAIFAVIMVHVSQGFMRHYGFESQSWWIANVYGSAVRWCVPVFVMVSGALLLDPSKQESLSSFYQKRLARVLLPTLFWTFFYIFVWAAFKVALGGPAVNVNEALQALVSGQPYYHMWFLYMILGLYLVTPFLRMVVSRASVKELWLFTGCAFILAAINGIYSTYFSSPFTNWFLMYIPYYVAGHLIRQSAYTPPRMLLWFVFLIAVVFTSLRGYIFSADYLNLYWYLSVTVIPMSISVMYLLKGWERSVLNERLTKKVAVLIFGVYLMHPMVLELIHYDGHESIHFHPALSIIVLTGVVFLVSLAAAWGIHKLPYIKRII